MQQLSLLLISVALTVVHSKSKLETTKIENVLVNADCEERAQEHDKVTWNYRGTLEDGTEFDSGLFSARIGHGDVIEGVDIGLRGMCKGDKRKITVPPHEGYGDEGSRSGSIPGGATIIFDMEMVQISRPLMPETTIIERTEEVKDCKYRSQVGDTIYWKYHGTLEDHTVFDSGTYSAKLGAGQVIVGVDTGMLDMCVGDKRKLILPHHEAYGERGYPGSIPPYATLFFDVEMTAITPGDSKEL